MILDAMKTFVRNLLPPSLLSRYRRFARHREQQRNASETVEQVFTEIYETNKWGGAHGEFCSEDGTISEHSVLPHVAMIADLAASVEFSGLTFVDLGCGDFRVGQRLLPFCARYVGVDVV